LNMQRGTVKSSLTTISKQVSKLTRLISELLDLSKIESGKLELHCSEFDLAELVEEVVQDMRQVTSNHAIIVHTDFDRKIFGDKDRIGQVLTNLLNNAIKYSPAADRVEVYVHGNTKNASVKVKDFGIGIDKKDFKKIFERFYRVEGKSEQTYPGFGIGLFIASEIIQRHHGTIDLSSEKGHSGPLAGNESGSLFTINLPLDFRHEAN
jgi:signal transduction histidine kinase